MITEIGTLVTVIATAVGGVVWAVRLEGKVLAHEQLDDAREEQRVLLHSEIKQGLQRIENKVDMAAGAAADAAKAAAVAMALLQRSERIRHDDQ